VAAYRLRCFRQCSRADPLRATKEEAAEAIGVTFLMHGGPATIYGARAYDAFSEFADAQADTGSGS
jgi:hypothetical protein